MGSSPTRRTKSDESIIRSLAVLQNEVYYIAKGVRPCALWEVEVLSDEDLVSWLAVLTNSTVGFNNGTSRGNYKVDFLYKEVPWRTSRGIRRILISVIYSRQNKTKAARTLELAMDSRKPEQTRELGLLLGYAPELVDDFVGGVVERKKE